MNKTPKTIILAVIIMALVGLLRGFGGVHLLLKGKTGFPDCIANDTTILLLGIFLVLIGIVEIISAIGVFKLKRFYWILGIIVTIAFVIDGAINGYFLFGSPKIQGQVMNIVVAAVIIGCLWISRKTFQKNS